MKASWIWALAGVICFSISTRADLTQVHTTGSWDGNTLGTLNTVMQSLTGNSSYNVNSPANRVDDSSDQVWTAANGSGSSTMLLTIAGYAWYNSFGIYNLDNNQQIQIFGGGTSGATSQSISFNNGTVTVGANSLYVGNDFGFYLDTPGGQVWYSVESQNSDGGDHMVTLTTSSSQTLNLGASGLGGWAQSGKTVAWNPDSYLLGWEDLAVSGQNTGDVDYQDMLVEITGVAPIPEPTTVIAGALLLIPLGTGMLRKLRK